MSLGILYNHRDPLSCLCVRLADKVSIFIGRIEFERSNLSNRSVKLFTLSSLYQATGALLGFRQKMQVITQEEEEMTVAYWTEATKYIAQWKSLMRGETSSSELRKNCLNAHGIALIALGYGGRALVSQYPSNWKIKMKGLNRVNWSRSNKSTWEGRAISSGRILASQNNIILVTNVVKRAFGLPLAQHEQELESHLRRG